MYRIGEDWIFQQYIKETTKQKLVEGDFYYDEEADTVTPKKPSNDNFDDLDKRMLANKFFELNA